MSYDYSQHERISSFACDALIAAVRDPHSTVSTLSYEERRKNLKQYGASMNGIAAPCYDKLPELLSAVGVSYKAFFSLLGTPLQWSDARTAAMAEKLEKLTEHPEAIEQLYRCTQAMLPEVWSSDIWGWTPSYRLHMWRMYVCDPAMRVRIRAEYKDRCPRFFNGTNARSRINTEDIAGLGLRYGTPFHWLLCMSPNDTLMASAPEIENLMDDYIRLPDKSKRVVEALVDYALEEQGRN